MKNLLYISFFLLISQFTFSQICEEISPYKQGMSLEYTNYNKKGKETSVEKYYIESVTNDGAGNLAIDIQITEGKNAKTAKNHTLKCSGGDFYVDMANYTSLNEGGNNSFQIKAKGDFIKFPNKINEGTTLEDGKIDLTIGDGNTFATMQVLNRKLVKIGALTTKAGTYDGYIISFDYVFNIGILKIRGSGKEWYVKGVGIIKTENYSKKGKLRSTRELTKLNN